jgi:hypothetical protein
MSNFDPWEIAHRARRAATKNNVTIEKWHISMDALVHLLDDRRALQRGFDLIERKFLGVPFVESMRTGKSIIPSFKSDFVRKRLHPHGVIERLPPQSWREALFERVKWDEESHDIVKEPAFNVPPDA